ncbi:RdgB/HAM1 family non-canonical purine NTP pyrophosphatase [Candidatus Parcubacteria bacterium]|jgi:XTP/dITP diphosphohydrolase|nr:RdgB/HAM1 family non-canonical purine NTP pyrophosphatase [Candidatus Parcubacteria bacterium]MBT7228065.1 RdgB/HAM1 family non-canonical purine NTP pyrophosphatase [Candidatus Parcubacteria bacterium]
MTIISNGVKLNKLLIATHNPGKFSEIKKQLEPLGLELVSLTDLGIKDDFEETGQTFEENALGKAKFYYNIAKIPTLADDSGLSVGVLDGEPGVKSRRWPGYEASDEELLQMLLDKMKDVPQKQRTAKFVCVMALYDGKKEIITRGEKDGLITKEQMCPIKKGISYSSVFILKGSNKVSSELSIEEKNAVSHRGIALEELIKQING